MKQFQIYLRSELGKLSNLSETEWFLRSVSHEVLETCGLSKVATELTETFRFQHKVDAFVETLSADHLKSLTKTCDHDWRKNRVYDKLNKRRDWQESDIPIDSIDVQQAEPTLGFLFSRNDFQLSRLVADPALGQHDPYKVRPLVRLSNSLSAWRCKSMAVIGSSMESTEEFNWLETAKRRFGSFTLRHDWAAIESHSVKSAHRLGRFEPESASSRTASQRLALLPCLR